MKRLIGYIGFVLCFLFVGIITVQADMGPKKSITVEIVGMEESEYTVTFIGTKTPPPYGDWERDEYLEYHPIMDYHDDEGFKFVGQYWVEQGDSTVRWGYYPPSPFKILIMTSDGTLYVSEKLESYAFSSYFKVDLEDILNQAIDESGIVTFDDVDKNYHYGNEITSFALRLILTIIIELAIAYLFLFRKKKELVFIFGVNIVTQVFLNGMLNWVSYKNGYISAIILLIGLEIVVLFIESIAYTFKFKEQGVRAILYALIANLTSFILGFWIYSTCYSSVIFS
jgi:hypothetical protein